MLIAHKIALVPNNKQWTYFSKAAGVARFAYNWALAQWQEQYEAWKVDANNPKPSQAGLLRQLNAVKQAQFPWTLEVTKNAPQMAIIQLSVREWICTECDTFHHRDINAAINLKNYAVSSTVSACGEEGSGLSQLMTWVKPASVKQEVNTKTTFA